LRIKAKINPKEDKKFNFKKVIEMQLEEHIDIIEEVCNRASKEFIIRGELDLMKSRWKELIFTFSVMKNTDISFIKNFDDIILLTDEHLSTTASLIYSP